MYDDDESRDDQGQKLNDAINTVANNLTPTQMSFLSEATYTMSERGMWPDDGSVSLEQIIKCWLLVEWVRGITEFPDDMKM